jgi:hypothetical protein
LAQNQGSGASPETSATREIPLAPLAILGGAALALEVLLTKFLAYSVAALLVYVVLGIALLGFGAAGTLTAAFPGWARRKSPSDRLGWASLGFVATTLVAFAVFVRLTPRLTEGGAATFAAALLLALPFLSAGLAIALALEMAPVGRAYAANLVGSALGCLAPFVLLPFLGGQRMIAALAGLGWVAALLFRRAARRGESGGGLGRLDVGLLAALLLVVAAFAAAPRLYDPAPEPAPHGQLDLVRARAASHGVRETRVYDKWNAVGRIEIFQYDGVPDAPSPYPFLFYVQDSSAGSSLAQWDGKRRGEGTQSPHLARACEDTVWGQAYFAHRSRALVIGLGGGMDVQCALYHGASAVDVVEINPDSISALRGRFDRFVGDIGKNPAVTYHLGDGRSFVHRAANRGYDVIQLSGVDTKNSSTSGGLALSENTLYTTEAFLDYLGNLNDAGVLSIVRFSDAEAVRLSHTAVTALRALGVKSPADHVVVLSTSYVRGVLVSKTPFSEADLNVIAARYKPPPGMPFGIDVYYYSAMGMDFRVPTSVDYAPRRLTFAPASAYFASLAGGAENGFVAAYPFDVAPATDDRPFFFDVFRYAWPALLAYPHVKLLGSTLASVLVLGVILVLLPVGLSRSSVKGAPPSSVAFFAALGLAYLFVEVWLIHRFGMYLGHQSYSLGVVLAALLSSTGFGAFLGERLLPSVRRNVATGVLGIGLLLVVGHLALPAVLDTTASAPFAARIAVAIGYTALLGACMGLPFPAGLRWARASAPDAVPWYVGINGFSSVVATIAVVPVSHALGYAAVMWTGGALYVLAAGLFALSERRVRV